MAFTPTYATIEQLREYTGQAEAVLSDDRAEEILRRAERDIDSLAVVGWPTDETTGLRFDPAALSDTEALALRRATCAQAEYRLEMGDSFFVKGQYEEVSGPEFSTKGKLGRIGPQTFNELRGAQLIKLSTTTTNRRGDLDQAWRP